MFQPIKLIASASASYAVRLARTGDEVKAAQALRFAVFNLELNEGLEESFASGLDSDLYDAACDHLLVEYQPTKMIVGTYRMQTGCNAAAGPGYYSAQEFDFLPYESLRGEIMELGRACVHAQHRNLVVLGLLWKGIADYARSRHVRYLLGCSSITSQDPTVGASAYSQLCRKHLAPTSWRTRPLPGFECSLNRLSVEPVKIPKLLSAYLSIGAQICGPPALDRSFKTIDFLTWLDLSQLPFGVRQKFMG